MKRYIKRTFALLALLGLTLLAQSRRVLAEEYQIDAAPLPHATADPAKITAVLTIVFGIVGALSLLTMTIGGFKYITSQGDSQAVAKAKNTIIYALVGLLVSILATAIVTFVIGRVG